jgi:branched-chain amino acid transport system permease protein
MTPEFWEFWIGLLLVVLVLVGRERIGEKIAGLPRRLIRRRAA